jgi:hypothetical protein
MEIGGAFAVGFASFRPPAKAISPVLERCVRIIYQA